MNPSRLPPGQQLAAPGKWPLVGEREPAPTSGPWSVAITGCVESPQTWSLAELSEMPQVEQCVDVHCVTRWSMLQARFSGVPLIHLLDIARPTREARFVSFVAGSLRQHSTSLTLAEAMQLDTLIALSYNGLPLPVEHGGPVRSVVPQRYFYKSVKWLVRIELLAEDRLGFWERTAGYHNHADPWTEERFVASSITKQEAARILANRDISGRELLGLDGSNRDLQGLNARQALLRNANFKGALLIGACFDGANLSNARFAIANLRGASFRRADLEGADFSGADLSGADLRGASLLGATFFSLSDIPTAAQTKVDANTRFSAAALESLTPAQADFIRQQTSVE